jgi:hypothetical protein
MLARTYCVLTPPAAQVRTKPGSPTAAGSSRIARFGRRRSNTDLVRRRRRILRRRHKSIQHGWQQAREGRAREVRAASDVAASAARKHRPCAQPPTTSRSTRQWLGGDRVPGRGDASHAAVEFVRSCRALALLGTVIAHFAAARARISAIGSSPLRSSDMDRRDQRSDSPGRRSGAIASVTSRACFSRDSRSAATRRAK